jgi:hypothetical protein
MGKFTPSSIVQLFVAADMCLQKCWIDSPAFITCRGYVCNETVAWQWLSPCLFVAADVCGNLVAGRWLALDICSDADIPAFSAARHSIIRMSTKSWLGNLSNFLQILYNYFLGRIICVTNKLYLNVHVDVKVKGTKPRRHTGECW